MRQLAILFLLHFQISTFSNFQINFSTLSASTVNTTLYINRGNFITVQKTSFPYLAFNGNEIFKPQNIVINLTTDDVLNLTVINNDSVVHNFAIKEIDGTTKTINPSDTVSFSLTFPAPGIYIYYDNIGFPKYHSYMGLSGMVCVKNSTDEKSFYWNIKEHQAIYNKLISQGGFVSMNVYEPDYFTINGWSHPDLQYDKTAVVTGKVGDTIHIFIANTGQSNHSIHFHGFHCRVLFSSEDKNHLNRIKDTFSIKNMQSMILELIPDKVGKYSVHDHNLVAVSGGGIHPNGMFVIMEIK